MLIYTVHVVYVNGHWDTVSVHCIHYSAPKEHLVISVHVLYMHMYTISSTSFLHFIIRLQVRSAIAKISSLSLKDVRLIRDKATSTSRGFCFVELNSIDVSTGTSYYIQ